MPAPPFPTTTPLSGLSNHNVRIDTPTGVYVLRLARPDGSGYVDRAHECAVTATMAGLGIGAPFVAGDAANGWLITEYVAGAEALTGARLSTDPVALAGVVAAFKRLQAAPVRFERVFDPFETIDDYLTKLSRTARPLALDPALLAAIPVASGWVAAEPLPSMAIPDRRPLTTPPVGIIQDAILREVAMACLSEHGVGTGGSSEALAPLSDRAVRRADLVPAHGDPTPANMLFDGVAVTLIDWEYAAMAHPLWDFAGLAVEAALPQDVEVTMLAMAGARPSRAYVGLKFAALMVSGLWAALRDETERPDHPIRALRDERLALATVLADRILAV